MRVNPWLDERLTDQLGEMIDAGLSCNVAAARLGMSRGAVIGRAWRLGWRFGTPRTPEQRNAHHRRRRPGPKPGAGPGKPRSTMPPEYRMYQFQARFDVETADEIRAVAARHKVSLAEAVRLLVEWGLEVESEAA